MAEEVYMDIPAVQNMSQQLGRVSEVLAQVNTVLEGLSMTLKTTAFIGLVGGYAVANFIDRMKPYIKEMSDKCAELSSDVRASVDAYERGDALGATRFY
ncbi:MAG: hypothetical protein H6642_06210 [Caldilineaceae bacterium]|nr:hypothetical protein [Caldilineaceae bacterium]MCB9137922.1 hypothetical protein [Caldilineaceae bacterium]